MAGCLLLFWANTLAAEQVRVMQWNIHGTLGNISSNTTAGAQALARIVKYNQPDVLLFNEVQDTGVAPATTALVNWVTNNVPYLGSQPGVTFFVAVSSKTDGYIRNGAISRYPILNETTYDDGMRGLHAFTVQLATTNLQIFHAHLKCCSTGTSCTTKQTQAQFDANTISSWASTHAFAYIFGGDWNEDEEHPECTLSATYHPITTIRTNGGLAEFKPTTLNGQWLTWSTATTPSIRFDYILAATNRLSPVSGFVFSTMDWAAHGLYTNAGAQNLVNDTKTASDHFCVFADYSFSAPVPNLAVSPAGSFTSAGTQGGPFSPSSQVYTLTNSGSGSLNWTATKTANWLTLSATSGTLASGATTNVTVSINANANSLAVNTYSDTVSFANAVNGVGNTTTSVSLTINPTPPVADFTFGPTNGTAPLSVSFTNLSTGATDYSWSFGDGNTSTLADTANTYTNPGTYCVTLTAVGPGGTNTLIRTNCILVAYPPPVVDFTAGPTNGTAPLSVSFTNLSTGATNYSWAFGDGNISTLTNAPNTYTNPGTYSVSLTAVGPGGSNTLTLANYIVAVNPPPHSGLQLVDFSVSAASGCQFTVTNADGTPVTEEQQSRIAIYSATDPSLALTDWTALTNSTLLTNGLLQVNDTNSALYPQRFYRAVVTP